MANLYTFQILQKDKKKSIGYMIDGTKMGSGEESKGPEGGPRFVLADVW